MEKFRIILTGATGLLGSAILSKLQPANFVIPLSLNGHNESLALDLMNPSSLTVLEKESWNAIIHCAAFRSPDYCMEHRNKAYALNSKTPEMLAEVAAKRHAKFIHISTDYVFDGTNPPYKETDTCNPVNYYGETKMLAEQNITKSYPDAVILRVPALYGQPPPRGVSTLVEEVAEALLSKTESRQDNVIVRYPTHTSDIADVVSFLLETQFSGIVHASGNESATRYELAVAIGTILNIPYDHIVATHTDPQRKEKRPTNSRLSTDLIARIGGPIPSGYSTYMPELVRKSIDSHKKN